MINQGERVTFKGYFEKLVDGEWEYVTPLKQGGVMLYDVVALVNNETRNKKATFTTKGEVPTITIVDSDTLVDSSGNPVQLYVFEMSSELTASMLGECGVEVSLLTYASDDTTKSNPIPLITDNKGTFVIQDSLLGRTLVSSSR